MPHPPQLVSSVCSFTHTPAHGLKLPPQSWVSLGYEHAPPAHVIPQAHGVSPCQVPEPSHVCGVRLKHCVVPGTQLPLQRPAPAQTNPQVLTPSHSPFASHVCTSLPEH